MVTNSLNITKLALVDVLCQYLSGKRCCSIYLWFKPSRLHCLLIIMLLFLYFLLQSFINLFSLIQKVEIHINRVFLFRFLLLRKLLIARSSPILSKRLPRYLWSESDREYKIFGNLLVVIFNCHCFKMTFGENLTFFSFKLL